MRNINYPMVIAIVIAIAAHIYLGQTQPSDGAGAPSWPTVQQLIRSA